MTVLCRVNTEQQTHCALKYSSFFHFFFHQQNASSKNTIEFFILGIEQKKEQKTKQKYRNDRRDWCGSQAREREREQQTIRTTNMTFCTIENKRKIQIKKLERVKQWIYIHYPRVFNCSTWCTSSICVPKYICFSMHSETNRRKNGEKNLNTDGNPLLAVLPVVGTKEIYTLMLLLFLLTIV